jgi:hypothetical protein
MATDFVIVTDRITDVNHGIPPVEIEFETRNADPTKPSVLLLERRRVHQPLPVELNDTGINNGVRRNESDDFIGQSLPIPPGTLHTGTKRNVLRLTSGQFLASSQVDNIVLFYTSKRVGPPAEETSAP